MRSESKSESKSQSKLESNESRCVRVRVSGNVQGVGFRYATLVTAESLGARGWVRNLPDRRVEAVFEGRPEVVERALGFIHEGPPGSRVDFVELVTDERVAASAPRHAGFEIRE